MYRLPIIISILILSISAACHNSVDKNKDKITEETNMELPDSNPDRIPSNCAKEKMQPNGIVRLSKIEIYPECISEYMEYAKEVGEISLRTEPGVLTMYAICEKDNPCMVTILETYASKDAYEKHIASEHFQKYKRSTIKMIKSLKLVDQTPLNQANKIVNFIE